MLILLLSSLNCSAGYQFQSAIGQPSPLMDQDAPPYSTLYDLYPGFWYTLDAGLAGVAPADVNGDGTSDLIWHNVATGETSVWVLDETGVSGYLASGSESDIDWQLIVTGDFDDDGCADFLWSNAVLDELKIWFMNRDGFVREQPVGSIDPDNFEIHVPVDCNGDGCDDLILRDMFPVTLYYWHLNADGFASSDYLGTVEIGNANIN